VSTWFSDQRVTFAFLAAVLMIATRCVRTSDARRNVEWSVLVTIAASFGVGIGLAKSGAAAAIAHAAIEPFGALGPEALLAGVYTVTWILTELMSNNAAAALMFPIALATAQHAGLDPRPFAVAIAIGASCGFLFPAGYQTHLMVYGPGGYRVRDFVKTGIPMALLWFAMSIFIIPRVWPLR
jgi:di/tricarboxylate transporter